MTAYYQIAKAKYLYKDQYGKHVFEVKQMDNTLEQINKKCKDYETINPIYQKEEGSAYLVRFNSTDFNFKNKCDYSLSYYIQKTVKMKEGTQKCYINLHINECVRLFKKQSIKTKIEDV